MIPQSSRACEPCTKTVSGKKAGSSSQKGRSVEGEEAKDVVTVAYTPRMADTTPHEIKAVIYGSGVSMGGKELKRGE